MRLTEPELYEPDFICPMEPCTCPRCLRRVRRPAGFDPSTGRPWLCFHCLFPSGRIRITEDGHIVAADNT